MISFGDGGHTILDVLCMSSKGISSLLGLGLELDLDVRLTGLCEDCPEPELFSEIQLIIDQCLIS